MNTLPHHPFRFGLISYSPSTNIIIQARRAEELGYSAFHLSDHMFNMAPIAAITAAAMATTTLRIGSMVFGNDFWHPAILAREALAIDGLSNGRLEFGIGSGWYSEDYKQLGIQMDVPAVRISRLEESVSILKGLLAGEVVTFEGKYYNICALDLAAKPVQQPHVPLTIGGGGKRVLSLAARQADIISFSTRSTPSGWVDISDAVLEENRRKVEWVCQAAGERLAGLEFSVFVSDVVVTDNVENALDKILKDKQSWGSINREQVMESPQFLVGDLEQIVAKLQLNRERFGFSYYVLWEGSMENFAPVVKRLAGK